MSIPIWMMELQALSTPMIAAGAGLIAYQQFRVARRKLRLDLFDRRYAILEAFQTSVRMALNQTEASAFDESTGRMIDQLNHARFLLSRDLFDYLDDVSTRVLQLRHSTLALKRSHLFDVEQSYIDLHHENLRRLLIDLKRLPIRMSPFLKVDDRLSVSLRPMASDMPGDGDQTSGRRRES